MTPNAYDAPQPEERPTKPTKAFITPPAWFWRLAFGLSAFILVVDGSSRGHADVRPSWFTPVAVVYQLALGVAFLLLTFARFEGSQEELSKVGE